MTLTRACGIYVRISDDRAGEAAGVARQETDCRAVAERHGWTVAEVYRENDTSAFKRRRVRLPDGSTALRVVRPEFRRMLADLDGGAIAAVVVYDLDRLARDPRDLEDIIDTVEQRKIPTASVTGSFDLSTDSGVSMARVLMAMNNKASRDTARRVARKHVELAEQGRPGGGGLRPYGYTRGGTEVVEDEAEVVRWIADQVLAGDSLRAISAALNADGVPTVRGGPWQTRSVHTVISKPRAAGLRTHHGEVVGKATWPAILDRDTWERLLLALDGRRGNANNVLEHWMSGVLLCGKCQRLLTSWWASKGSLYRCPPRSTGKGCGGVSARCSNVEDVAERLILGYLSRPDVLADIRSTTTTAGVDVVRRELANDETQLRELAGMWAARQVTTSEYLAARKVIEERLERARRHLSAVLPGAVRTLLNADNLEERWKALGPSERRDVARAVFPDGVILKPAVRNAGARWEWNPERVAPVGWETS